MKNAYTHNIVYITLGFKWLNQAFCPASAFVAADKNEARNPQRFIHVTIGGNAKKRHSTHKMSNLNGNQESNSR
jgi:hypothetical protein